jgi:hypothetical protein
MPEDVTVETVSTVPSNASLPSIARILEDEYGVPWELLNRFANKIADAVLSVAGHAVGEFAGDWLDW